MRILNGGIIMLDIHNLTVEIGGRRILNGVNLNVEKGQVNVLFGPNGAGKSALLMTLMGFAGFNVVDGKIIFKGEDITHMSVYERAQRGLGIMTQRPPNMTGVKLHALMDVISKGEQEYQQLAEMLDMKRFLDRDVNVGFSGGEKKKNEIAQILMFKPKLVILDEIDSGLDVDAIKIVGKTLKEYYDSNDVSFLIITHHTNILKYLKPTHVHVIDGGKIIKSGDNTLATQIEKDGYKS